jgi:hypothetical protein
MSTYYIIRMWANRASTKIIKKGLTLEEAQEHCQDPETSGSTCSDLSKRGMWFDGYSEE